MITAADKFASECVAAGCDKDQIKNFVSAGYVPHAKQLEFHAECRRADVDGHAWMIGFGGRRGPGKTHATFAQVALDDCQRFSGLKFLFLRKVAKAARESFEDLRRSVLAVTEHTYKAHRGLVEFPNGSRIILGHFNNDKDIDAYLGIEYDGMAVEEANTLTEKKLTLLFGSLRTSKENWRPRAYLTFNPGGVGHANIKRMFIQPWRDGTETTTRFVSAGFMDNPFTHENYKDYLESLTGWLGRAWRDGDWDIAAGQFFTNWKRDVHVGEFDTYGMDRYWMSKDYGFNHWDVTYLAGESDGIVYVIDELAVRKTLAPTIAARIKSMLSRHALYLYDISAFPAGHDIFAQRGTGETIAEQYQKYDIILDRAKLDRINGASAILTRFGDEEHGIAPTVKIHPRCVRLIENIPSMQHDPNRPEDVLKVNADEEGQGGDDFYDAFRYLIMEAGQGSGGWGTNPIADYRG